MQEIWIYSDNDVLLVELVAGAKALGNVSVVSCTEQFEAASSAGADCVYELKGTTGAIAEDCVYVFENLIRKEEPDVVIFGSTIQASAIAGRLAARLGTSLLADAKKLELSDGNLDTTHMVYGGKVNVVQRAKGPVSLVMAGFGAMEKGDVSANPDCRRITLPYESCGSVILEAVEPVVSESCDLSAAKRVVCIGQGVAKEEDIPVIRALADALDAELGCTRPIDGLGWMPKGSYIGISGVSTKADLYLAVGVSGQVQHMVGVSDSKLIAAINKDANAPIMQECDYGLVGDLYQLVPALEKKLKEV